QLHDDEELAVDDVVALQGEDVGVAYGLDAAERLQLLLGALPLVAGLLEVAVDELDGLEQPARGLGLPDFTEAAAAQALDEPVAGDGLSVTFDPHRHGSALGSGWGVRFREASLHCLGAGGGARGSAPSSPTIALR